MFRASDRVARLQWIGLLTAGCVSNASGFRVPGGLWFSAFPARCVFALAVPAFPALKPEAQAEGNRSGPSAEAFMNPQQIHNEQMFSLSTIAKRDRAAGQASARLLLQNRHAASSGWFGKSRENR